MLPTFTPELIGQLQGYVAKISKIELEIAQLEDAQNTLRRDRNKLLKEAKACGLNKYAIQDIAIKRAAAARLRSPAPESNIIGQSMELYETILNGRPS